MRKLSIFAALVVAMGAVSCVQDINDGTPAGNDGAVTFEASFGVMSKAVLEPGATESKVSWEAGDQVSVLAGEANYLYTAAAAGYSTTLSTEATGVPTEGEFYAVYPYDADATLAEGVITTELPAEQTAVLGSFSTHLAVAQANGTTLAFKNVCGLVKVNVSAENVTKIVLEGNSGEVVAGAINVTVADAPTWTAVAEQGATSVSLAAASGTLAKGDYYFAVLPQTFDAGFKVTAYKGETASVIRDVTTEVTIARADIVAGKSFGIDGEGTEASPYILKTAQDMVDMRSLAKVGGETWFKLGADIDMQGVTNYVPVNYGDTVVEGETSVTTFSRKINFDGNGKTISNFSCNFKSYPSLFGVLWGSVKDLTVTGASITSTSVCGIIAGYAGTVQNDVPMPAVLENVVVSGELTANADRCGGLAGVGYNVTVTNCSSDVKINASSLDNGGLFGQLQGENALTACNTKSIIVNTVSGNARTGSLIGWNRAVKTTVTNCHVLEGSSVTIEKTSSNISGFIAFADNANLNTELTVTNCSSKANVTTIVGTNGSTNVSAFIGAVGYTGSKVNIVDCFAEGTIKASGNYCGGIVGRIANDSNNTPKVTITGCHYSGTQSGRAGAGGLVGGVEGGSVSISKSYASGTLTINTSGNQGGLLGLLNATATATIENCWSDHALTIPSGSQHAGGIIGCANGKAVIKNTFAKGDIKGSRGIGGIVGHVKGAGGEISGCIAWNSKIEGDRAATNWACGAIIGAAHSQGVGTYKNCWRRADMVLVDVVMKLTDHEDVINARPPFPDYAPADATQNAYHGKAAAADATISSVAKSIGWDETIWDLSGATPVLK